MLLQEIENAQRSVRTDAYQMSIGEVVSMYDRKEIIIDPEFQRLFRWDISQKSKLIESLLLGIPLPSIFVFENEAGDWELIDGLQRVSTVLEFMGVLQSPDGGLAPPSILDSTKYLPSLHNTVWERSERIQGVALNDQVPLDKTQQLSIRRGRLGVEILKRPSDNKTKYDLFQRLNAGGTQANAQELRNCIMLMVNPEYFRAVKSSADKGAFQSVIAVNDEQLEKQRHLEMAVRFLVHARVPYDGRLDVEEYIDEGIVSLARAGKKMKPYPVVRVRRADRPQIEFDCQVLIFDRHRDIAVLKLIAPQPSLTRFQFALGDVPVTDQPLTSVGFPNYMAGNQAATEAHTVQDVRKRLGVLRIRATGTIMGGASGGPLLNKNFEVVGITHKGLLMKWEANEFISTAELPAVLKEIK